MSGDKTELPTAKKRAEAARRGDLPDVRDASTALVLLAGFGWLALGGGMIWRALGQTLRAGLALSSPTGLLLPLLQPMAMLALATLVAALAARALGGGIAINPGIVTPKPARISPAAGLRRILGPRGITEFSKAIAKLVLLGGIVAAMAGTLIARLSAPVPTSPLGAFAAHAGDARALIAALIGGLILIAAIDLPLQMRLRTQRLMMSRQEVRDEARESEHSPEIRRQIHARRHALLDGSARKAVQEASVVLVKARMNVAVLPPCT